jgi:hypothetical protein
MSLPCWCAGKHEQSPESTFMDNLIEVDTLVLRLLATGIAAESELVIISSSR